MHYDQRFIVYTLLMKFVRFWLPVALWMGVIFFFSTRSRIQVSPDTIINFLFFKTLHVLEYSFLYILLFRAFKYTKPKEISILWYISAFLITVLYACSDEIHQRFIPTREGALRDVIIDAGGAVVAWIAIIKLLPKLPAKLQKWVRSWQLL
jgi:VanZ family protein